jgi:hypothetical protein
MLVRLIKNKQAKTPADAIKKHQMLENAETMRKHPDTNHECFV